MPLFQAMAARANAELTRAKLKGFDKGRFAPGTTLVDELKELKVVRTDAEAAFLEGFPSGMLAAVRALLHDNLAKEEPLDVTFAWAPGYDDELTIWQVADGASVGGITVLVRSRYPDDRTQPGQGIRRS